MFTLYSTQELHDFVAPSIHGVSKNTGHYKFVLDALSDFSVPFGEALVNHCVNNVGAVSTLETCISRINSVGNDLEERFPGQGYFDEFQLVKSEVEALPKTQTKERACFLNPSQANEYFRSIESAEERALKCLTYLTGCLPSDLFRPSTDLSQVANGVVVVGVGFNPQHTKTRTIKFDPTLLNDLDPEGELIEKLIVEQRTTTVDNLGRKGYKIKNGTKGCDKYSLRNCHALNLLNDGFEIETVAEIQGVKPRSLSDRLTVFKEKVGLV